VKVNAKIEYSLYDFCQELFEFYEHVKSKNLNLKLQDEKSSVQEWSEIDQVSTN